MPRSPGDVAAPDREAFGYWQALRATDELIQEGRTFSGHERNCCFLNVQGERFANISAASGLDFLDDGRGIAITDWDRDGDLDLWLVNRSGPRIRFLRNDHPPDHEFLAVRLEGRTVNRDAIGARVELEFADATSRRLVKTLRAGEGFASQSTKWIHFGLGRVNEIEKLRVRWPGGPVEEFTSVQPGQHYKIVQGTGRVQVLPAAGNHQLASNPAHVPPPTEQARLILMNPLEMPPLTYRGADGHFRTLHEPPNQPVLINVWASWCQACREELADWSAAEDALRAGNVRVIALSVDEPTQDWRSDWQRTAEPLVQSWSHDFEFGLAAESLAVKLDIMQRAVTGRQRSLPIPSSFLLDPAGRLAVVYKGRVTVEQILADVQLLGEPVNVLRDAAVPLAGRWSNSPVGVRPKVVAQKFLQAGYSDEAEEYLSTVLARREAQLRSQDVNPQLRTEAALLYGLLVGPLMQQGRLEDVVTCCDRALRYNPTDGQARTSLKRVLHAVMRRAVASGNNRLVQRVRQQLEQMR